MIEITHQQNRITIKGHAQYAPHGQDIVCAAVSALVQTFVASVRELTADAIKADIAAGNVVIEYKSLSAESKTLLGSFFIGVRMIAETYPVHVRIATTDAGRGIV
jgi:uncharacterized protein YsxB (DUF464 family)